MVTYAGFHFEQWSTAQLLAAALTDTRLNYSSKDISGIFRALDWSLYRTLDEEKVREVREAYNHDQDHHFSWDQTEVNELRELQSSSDSYKMIFRGVPSNARIHLIYGHERTRLSMAKLMSGLNSLDLGPLNDHKPIGKETVERLRDYIKEVEPSKVALWRIHPSDSEEAKALEKSWLNLLGRTGTLTVKYGGGI
ncbi:MAG: hypothetical protein L6R36_003652 [Xanthoria steineri]|nr:MAG: hypothetical protein L6R36_003652 [Xanthoria steineri]